MEAVFDLEGDGLTPTKIHCLSVHTKNGLFSTTDYDQMRSFFSKATVLIGHNIIRWDIPVIERLLGISIKAKIVDTLALSWYLYPHRQRHGIDSFGEDFGIPKPVIDDWDNLTPEEYIHRCEEDVKINTHLWNAQWSKLRKIYDSEADIWKFLEYLTFKIQCAQKQERDKWKVDLEYCKEQLTILEAEQTEKVNVLASIMPRVAKYQKKTAPAKPFKKDGTFSASGTAWNNLLQSLDLPLDTQEVEVIHHYDEPNPSSIPQIKDWLFSLGWKPRTFKFNKASGNDVPQINLEHGKGICESVKDLYEIEPRLEVLDGLSTLNHRIPILRGLIESADENGYVKAQVQGLTNTLRFKHSHPCVNLPKPDRPYALAVRTSLIAPDEHELCGADMASLEDRLKQHFIYPLDPEYVNSMLQEDFDPHLTLAVMAGMMTKEEEAAYKAGDKSKKRIRDIAKNGNYACQYGAGAKRLVKTCDITLDKAKELFEGYWKLNWAVRAVAKEQKVKTILVNDEEEMWLLNPINGFYYSLREEKDRFSTLIQGTASYVFDLWVGYVLEGRDQLTAQFHDEIVLTVRKGFREQITKYLNKTIDKANDTLKLNRELGIGIQFGETYAEIH